MQLALAHHADAFLPELIGFNLGYEQLPLHLPITAYELNELDIDPYYFSLHVTIDNASTGHARKALQSVLDCVPRIGDSADFHRRVALGYQLNLVGMGTQQAIASFDLERELLRVLTAKAAVGAHLHSDYCRIGGRPVSDWLSSPGDMPAMLVALQSAGWIRRGQSPEQSRFWHLLTDEQAPMFDVFDGYEQQLIRDWIQADAGRVPTVPAINRFRKRPSVDGGGGAVSALPGGATVGQVIAHHAHPAHPAHDTHCSHHVRGAHDAGLQPRVGRCADVEALFAQLAPVHTHGLEKASDLAKARGLVASTARKAVVLNADDAACVQIAARVRRGTEIVHFGSDATRPALARHIANGGRAVFMQQGMSRWAAGNRHLPLTAAACLPGAPGAPGKCTPHVIAHAMAGWAALLAFGVAHERLLTATLAGLGGSGAALAADQEAA